jgi:restriction endonuclease S subunit
MTVMDTQQMTLDDTSKHAGTHAAHKLPQNWKESRLGEMALVQTGPFGSQLHESDYVADGTPIITVENLVGGKITFTTSTPMVSASDVRRLAKYTLREGDVVFSRVGAVDRSAYCTSSTDGWMFSGRILRVRPNPKLNPKYLNYYLSWEKTKNLIRNLAVGGTMPSLNTDILNFVPVYELPKQEQKRIVAILEVWDEYLEKLDKKIALKKNIKKGLMQQLLGGRVRLSSFSRQWSSRELIDIFEKSKKKYDPTRENTSYPCIELEHIQKGEAKLLGTVNSKNQKSIKNRFKPDDILFGKLRPYLKKFLRVDFEGVCSSEIWVLTPRPLVDKIFAFYLVQSDRFINAASVSSGSRMPRADWDYMQTVSFTIPTDIQEQKEIGATLQKIDAEISLLVQKKSIIVDAKAYLINNLITGKIRTPEDLKIPSEETHDA